MLVWYGTFMEHPYNRVCLVGACVTRCDGQVTGAGSGGLCHVSGISTLVWQTPLPLQKKMAVDK